MAVKKKERVEIGWRSLVVWCLCAPKTNKKSVIIKYEAAHPAYNVASK